eukprot:89343_1
MAAQKDKAVDNSRSAKIKKHFKEGCFGPDLVEVLLGVGMKSRDDLATITKEHYDKIYEQINVRRADDLKDNTAQITLKKMMEKFEKLCPKLNKGGKGQKKDETSKDEEKEKDTTEPEDEELKDEEFKDEEVSIIAAAEKVETTNMNNITINGPPVMDATHDPFLGGVPQQSGANGGSISSNVSSNVPTEAFGLTDEEYSVSSTVESTTTAAEIVGMVGVVLLCLL